MKFHPSSNRVLLKRVEAEEKTSGGLFIPGNAQEKPVLALVVAVGPGANYWDNNNARLVTMPIIYKEGDQVMIPKFGANEIKIEGEDFVLLQEHEILGKLIEE